MTSRGRGGNKYRGGGDVRGRGRGRGGRGGRGGYSSSSRGGLPHLSENTHHGFSLADEAKNTERHHGNYASNSLRHSRISFVAAGHLEPSELLKPLNANVLPPEEGQHLMQVKGESSIDSAVEEDEEEDVTMHCGETDSPAGSSTRILEEEIDLQKLDLDPPEKNFFVVDVTGDPSLKPKEQTPVPIPVYSDRSPSPVRPGSASSSGSERIVFIPRKLRPGLSRSNSQIPRRVPSPKREPPPHPVVEMKVIGIVTTQTTITTINDTIPTVPTIDLPSVSSALANVPFSRSTQGNKRRRKYPRKQKLEQDPAIEDYIENIAAQMRTEAAEDVNNFGGGESSDPIGGTSNRRDLGGDDSWSSTTDSEDAVEDSDAVNAYKASIWEGHELDDFEGVSTSSEGPKGPIDTIIGKRKRPSGLQYLIKWSGYQTDDATWVLAESLDPSADLKVKFYEEILIQKATDAENAAESTEDSEEDDEYSADDAKLARFLQRQEAMGVTESDIELNFELHEFMDLDSSRKGKKKTKGKSHLPDIIPNHRTGHFPSATRFADAYDGFDPMEWERPSLTAVKKGRVKGKKGKGKIPVLGLSDSELEDNIQSSWQKDREKKKARRAEREALRAEGLLGAKGGKRNSMSKWKEGMNVEELKEEIMVFLLSDHQSLALPPMSKSDRKLAHTFAGAFGLKSKSIGGGKTRFTTLYKTGRSSYFERDEDTITAVMNRKRFFGRPDAHVGRGGRNEARGRGGSSVVHHREGDIVGASAPEIAEDNKGRRMLEKMGYRTGMALGMDGNKGIVVPVAAVVKISKAGLG